MALLCGVAPVLAQNAAPHSAKNDTAGQASVPPASPESNQAPERIPEVVVSAPVEQEGKQFRRVPVDNPAGRDVLGPEEIAESGVISVQEVLRRTPSVLVSDESGSDSLANIGLRGVTSGEGVSRSTNVAMMVDGVPISPAPYGQPGTALFPFTLERLYAVDIQRGGASVRYGPNNVAGVINYLTRPIPSGSLVEFGVRYDSFDNGSLYNALGGTYGKWGVLLESVYKDGETFRDNGDYTIQNYALKTSYQFNPQMRLLLQLETYDDKSDLSDGLTLPQYRADPTQSSNPHNRFEGEQQRVSTKFEWQLGERTRAEVLAYYYESERTFFLASPQFAGPNPNFIQATPRPMDVWAVQPQITHLFDLGGGTAELVAGVRYLEEDIVRRVERYFPNGTQTVTGDAQFGYQALSAFAESRFVLGDWTVTPGVRIEQVDIDGQNVLTGAAPVEQEFTEFLPALNASYMLRDDWSVYANVQSSFKAPEASQLELGTNPQDIAAQYAWVYELGTRAQLWDGALSTDLTLYQIDYQDLLERDPLQFDVFVNAGETRHRGVELTLDADLGRVVLEGLGAWATVAYNDSQYQTGPNAGNQVIAAAPWLASWGLRYRHERTGLWGGIDGFFVDEAFTDQANTAPINAQGTIGQRPSYTVWNARVGLRRKLSKNCELRAEFDLRNLLDEEYFDIRPGGRGIFPGAPFSYGGQLGVTFSY